LKPLGIARSMFQRMIYFAPICAIVAYFFPRFVKSALETLLFAVPLMILLHYFSGFFSQAKALWMGEQYLFYGFYKIFREKESKKNRKKRLPLRGVKMQTKAKNQVATEGQMMKYKTPVQSSLPKPEDWDDRVQSLRKAAAVHKQVRQEIQAKLTPGINLLDVAEFIEKRTRELVRYDPKFPLRAGNGFPTGLSVNNIAAHWTPNLGRKDQQGRTPKNILFKKDLLKIDFGVHVNGNIIDCAFSCSFDPMHDKLMRCSKEAMETAVKNAGVDVRISDVAREVQEVIDSYDCLYGGERIRIKPVRNLCGHDMKPYRIHHGKMLPPVPQMTGFVKMDEYDVFAIEVFVSSGQGYCSSRGHSSHFMVNHAKQGSIFRNILSPPAKDLLYKIENHWDTLPWCRRWLIDQLPTPVPDHGNALGELVGAGFVSAYPPLVVSSTKNCYVAQYEHTVILHPGSHKEVVSRGDDF